MLPYAAQAISKVAPALATGAAQALGSLGINKIFGGFMIPQNKIDKLIKYKKLNNACAQLKLILSFLLINTYNKL